MPCHQRCSVDHLSPCRQQVYLPPPGRLHSYLIFEVIFYDKHHRSTTRPCEKVPRTHSRTLTERQRQMERKKRCIRKATHTFVNAILSICHTYIYITYIQTFLPFDVLFLNLFSPSPFPQFSLHSEPSSQQAMPENRYSRFTQINLKGNLKGNLAPGINIYMPASLSREEFIFVLMGSGEINCKRSAMPFHGEHYEGTRKATK